MKVKQLKEALEEALKRGEVTEDSEVIIVGEYGFGMQTLEMALRDLYLKKKITLEDALSRSSRPEEFKRGLQNS